MSDDPANPTGTDPSSTTDPNDPNAVDQAALDQILDDALPSESGPALACMGNETNPPSPNAVGYTLTQNNLMQAARGGTNANAHSMSDPQPLVAPQPQLFLQGNPTWQCYWMRIASARANPATFTTDDDWQQNGCHPTSLAMILNWWHCQNPDTMGSLTFPFPSVSGNDSPPGNHEPAANPPFPEAPGINPLTMCRLLFGYPYAISQGGNVDHEGLRNSVKPMVGTTPSTTPQDPCNPSPNPATGGVTGKLNGKVWPMQVLNYATGPTTVKPALQYLLQLGPVIIGLAKPSHFVVVWGYRNDVMYINDPGAILMSQTHGWGASPSGVTGAGSVVQIDCTNNSLVYNSTSYDKVQKQWVNNPALTGQNWLTNVASIESYYFDDSALHTEWSPSPSGS